MANLNATAKSTKRAARSGSRRRSGQRLTITTIANAMGEVHRLTGILDSGQAAACAVERKCAKRTQPHYDALRVNADCRKHHQAMMERLDALQMAIFHLDPETPSEVFSLALVLSDELDKFMGNFTDEEDPQTRLAGKAIDRAMKAVLLGFVRQLCLTSPIISRYMPPVGTSLFEASRTAQKAGQYLALKPADVDTLVARSEIEAQKLSARSQAEAQDT